MQNTNCGICDKILSFWNQPLLKKLNLSSGEIICLSCFRKINSASPKIAFYLKKHSLFEVNSLIKNGKSKKQPLFHFNVETPTSSPTYTTETKQDFDPTTTSTLWNSGKNIVGKCYHSEKLEPLPNGMIEIVRYKSDRFAELFGRGHNCSYFPRYGEIGNRVFEIWYQEFKSTEKKGMVEYKDIGIKDCAPHFAEKISNNLFIGHQLQEAREYLSLFSVKETKNQKTWYAGLKSIEYTGIITTYAVY